VSLTVPSVAQPRARVGRDAVGGAEQILTMLDRALVEAGHRSIVVACEGSHCAGTLFAVQRPAGFWDSKGAIDREVDLAGFPRFQRPAQRPSICK
jgi:hypothetical protein